MTKSNSIIIRVTSEEKKTIQKKANKVGMNVSNFARFLLLKTNIKEIRLNASV